MRSTFKILPYINRKRIKSDGTTAVLCRVSIDGKSILITTGIFCRPEDWNSQTGTIRQPRENNRLAEFRLNLERAYDRLLKEQGAVSAELLKNAVTGVATIPQTGSGCVPNKSIRLPRSGSRRPRSSTCNSSSSPVAWRTSPFPTSRRSSAIRSNCS